MREKIPLPVLLAGEAALLAAGLVWIAVRSMGAVGEGPTPWSEFVQQLTPQVRYLLLGVGMGGILFLLDLFVLRLVVPLPDGEESELAGMSIPAMIAAALASGFCEEVLFRGAMQPSLGLWITTALFGLGHFTSWQKVVNTASLGLLLGCAAAYFGNLWVPIAAHVTVNLIELYLLRD